MKQGPDTLEEYGARLAGNSNWAGANDDICDSIRQHIIGESRAICEVRSIIHMAALTDANVLITGASGTGKELVARAVHRASARAEAPMVAVNSGAIARDLVESQLFGHEKGSFTGATHRHIGYFECADQGTLFLDEIGDMPADMQVRLLRVLETRQVRRIGAVQERPVNVRLIAATHQSLPEAIEQGRFREDLFYRLAVLPIHIPPLSQRKEDIPALMRHLLQKNAHLGAPPQFSELALQKLMQHDWPGNVRELRNMLDRAMLFYSGQRICTDELQFLMGGAVTPGMRSKAHEIASALAKTDPQDGQAAPGSTAHIGGDTASPTMLASKGISLRQHLREEEMRLLLMALNDANGVVSQAARLLGLQRTTMVEKMRRYSIERDDSLCA